MSDAVRDQGTGPEARGGARFVDVAGRLSARVALANEGFIVASVEPKADACGRLGEVIDEAIERELSQRGAGCSSVPGDGSFSRYQDAALSDQLFRARRAGARGLALVLGSLRAATCPSGAVDPRDTATLAFLADATRERPLMLLLDDSDAAIPAHAKTCPLAEVLAPPPLAPTLVPPVGPAPVPVVVALAPPPPSAPAPAPAAPKRIAVTPEAMQVWRRHVQQLTAARGPQPLSALEKLFAESYVPLGALLVEGLEDPRAREAHDHFAASFARCYAEAFPTFAATGKRPRMVFDAYDVAARIARLHGARNVRLLLVDAMRWDVARRVADRLGDLSGASLTEELVLWSALPTTTPRQLETIGRGMEALRAPASLEPEAEPARGRNAEHVRRMRLGPREIYKIDLVESRVRAARGDVVRELPGVAEELADAVARQVEALAPRTLLFVFGDHGFTIDKRGFAAQGGASPEEVLVGAFALLVGDVH